MGMSPNGEGSPGSWGGMVIISSMKEKGEEQGIPWKRDAWLMTFQNFQTFRSCVVLFLCSVVLAFCCFCFSTVLLCSYCDVLVLFCAIYCQF